MDSAGTCSLLFDPATATEFLKLQRVLMRHDDTRATNADTLAWLFDAAKGRINELVQREAKRTKTTSRLPDTRDVVDILPAPIWHRIFRHLVLPPSRADVPAVAAVRNEPTGKRRASAPPQKPALAGGSKNSSRAAAVLVGSRCRSAGEQHERNQKQYGASWAVLCCALASRRLLLHVLTFSASEPTTLAYDKHQHPEWSKSVLYLLRWPHRQLALSFTEPEHLRSLGPHIACSHTSLTALSLKLIGFVDGDEEQEYRTWTLAFLKDCSQLQRLKLGRGMWSLDESCAGAAWVKSLRCLTIKHVHDSSFNYKFLESITPQLTEFTLYENRHLSRGPRFGSTSFSFSFANARVLHFRFATAELKLTLSLPDSLETLAVSAKWLVLDCQSSAPLSLHHLSLYGQDRLIISSLRLASVKVAYLNGPATHDDKSVQTGSSSLPFYFHQLPPEFQHLPKTKKINFSWSKWLRAIAPKVEVLIVRHGVPIERVNLIWRNLRSLGIVVETKDQEEPSWEAAVENWRRYGDEDEEEEGDERYGDEDEESEDSQEDEDSFLAAMIYRGEVGGIYGGGRGGYSQSAIYQQRLHQQQQKRQQKQEQVLQPPAIKAPKLESIFFPTRKPCEPETLASLKKSFPSLGLYCVIGTSYYWDRKERKARKGGMVGKGVKAGKGEKGGKGGKGGKAGKAGKGEESQKEAEVHVRRAKSGVQQGRFETVRGKSVREKMHSVNRRMVEGYGADGEERHMHKYKGRF